MTKQPEDPFYVGYLPKAPAAIAKAIVKAVLAIGFVLVIVAVSVAVRQEPAENSVFEFGTYTTLTGVIFERPYPLLRINAGQDVRGVSVYQSIPLVNLGKFGVADVIADLKAKNKLAQTEMTVNGTLIYYDGKSLLELSDGAASVTHTKPLPEPVADQQSAELVTSTFKGEIVDAKCFFGVMKPGNGKAHRSCAVRCIAGGIPPVLRVPQAEGGYLYYLITGPKGQPYNTEVLPYVGKPVTITGQGRMVDDWHELQVQSLEVANHANAFTSQLGNWLASLQRAPTYHNHKNRINQVAVCR